MDLLIGQLIELATTRKTVAGVYPHGKGSAIIGYGHPKNPYGQLHKVYKLPVHKMVGNEPGKEHKYFNSRKMKPYIENMVKHLKANKNLPPMLAMHHPTDRKSGIIIDGIHRIHAHSHSWLLRERNGEDEHTKIKEKGRPAAFAEEKRRFI